MKKIIIYSFIFLIMPLNIYASSKVYITDSAVRFRSGPSTNNSIIGEFAKEEEVTLLENKVYPGAGCSDGWFYVDRGNKKGYVCSTFVADALDPNLPSEIQTSYGRPWITPEKSIMGGAEFHAKDYISKGQYTSYFIKFNVAPDRHHNLHSHQYMTDIRAPFFKSFQSYDSAVDNGVANLDLHFIIPIYKNMPANTYDIKIYDHYMYSESEMNNTAVDKAFEDDLKAQGFDQSYIKRLRVIHAEHPNWTFEGVKTGLDFDEVAREQQKVGAIQSTNENLAKIPLEKHEPGWYIPNLKSTKMYVDPRNFLHHRYVMMFETIKYSKEHKEENVQQIINGTEFSGRSPLDNNKKFSTIFMEAAKKHNVSAIYLASSAKQEIGNGPSLSISGEEFTYNNVRYSGLFNFFNIGSFGGSNPAKSGLVYAGGGITGDASLFGLLYSKLKLRAAGDYAFGINPNTKASNYIKNEETYNSYVTDSKGKKLSKNALVKTGDKIHVSHKDNKIIYDVVIVGDITGKGNINSADLLAVRLHLLGEKKLSNNKIKAADINNDGKVNSADLLGVRLHLLGKNKIKQ